VVVVQQVVGVVILMLIVNVLLVLTIETKWSFLSVLTVDVDPVSVQMDVQVPVLVVVVQQVDGVVIQMLIVNVRNVLTTDPKHHHHHHHRNKKNTKNSGKESVSKV
jgi:hypothetical protein